MIYAHEIPSKSKLYFAKSASKKREIEFVASQILEANGYAEIITPHFSYHQHQEINEKSLIRLNDTKNHLLALRADSTLDVVRLITKRLGRSMQQKRWFYIQPVFRYPSDEQYQIGAEYLENSALHESINHVLQIIEKLELQPLLQISNIKIPQLLSEHLDIPIEYFKSSNLQAIFELGLPWLSELASLQDTEDIEKMIVKVPDFLCEELEKLAVICRNISYEHIIIAPLYYAKMRYYDGLFFRIFQENKRLGMGGVYHYDNISATGFALYTDYLIEELIER